MTTPGTTDDVATDVEETAAGLALAAGLDAVARLHDDALHAIAQLAENWDADSGDADEDGVRVVRLAERPRVTQRTEAAAA